jgi:hypothetical protein
MCRQLFARLDGLSDAELLWEPSASVWTVRRQEGGGTRPDQPTWDPVPDAAPPRTLAWSIGHLGAGSLVRADWLVGSHSLADDDVEWPMTATDAVVLLRRGLSAWRDGIGAMTDGDLDTIGRSAYPDGVDRQLPLLDIVWWVNKGCSSTPPRSGTCETCMPSRAERA